MDSVHAVVFSAIQNGHKLDQQIKKIIVELLLTHIHVCMQHTGPKKGARKGLNID